MDRIRLKANARAELINYSYEIGTPYARFLKEFHALQATAVGIGIADSKNRTAQLVFNYVKSLAKQLSVLKEGEALNPLGLFEYLAAENNLVRLDKESCDFLLKYINLGETDTRKMSSCKEDSKAQKGPKDTSFIIVKP